MNWVPNLLMRLIPLLPIRASTCNDIGLALLAKQQYRFAAAFFARAVALDDRSVAAIYNLGVVHGALGQYDEAIRQYQLAIEHEPSFVDALNNLGGAFHAKGDIDLAEWHFRHALAIDPAHAKARINMGRVMDERGRPADAARWYRSVLADHPADPEARFSLAVMDLKAGNWDSGWREYEWRLHRPSGAGKGLAPLVPGLVRWEGESLTGRRILLVSEQGSGDTIHFCRFADTLAAMGARVFMSAPADLVPLLRTLNGVSEVCESGRESELGTVDCWSPLLSVARFVARDESTFVRRMPYLRADPNKVEQWRRRMPAKAGSFRVGLVWAGNPSQSNDRNRSMDPLCLGPLLLEGCTVFGLQKPAGRRPGEAHLHARGMTELGPQLRDYSDTAAVIANLDLVVSVDTSVAHLAGALGRPVWILLCAHCDWRWLEDRVDSPWYPAARLYLQRNAGDWAELVSRVARDLESVSQAAR